jgi:hypothetical protein
MVECCYTVSFTLSVVNAECHKLALYAQCHYAECQYAECHGTIILSVHLRIHECPVHQFGHHKKFLS